MATAKKQPAKSSSKHPQPETKKDPSGSAQTTSTPKEMKHEVVFKIPKDKIFHFAWSKEGKHLALALGQQINDAVLLTNFE